MAAGTVAVLLGGASADHNRCSISVTPVQFGTYNGLKPTDVRSTGTIIYNCTLSEPISISLERGGAPSFENRHMKQGGSELDYNLYLDAAGTIIWGDGTGGSQLYRDPAPPPNTSVSIPVYGRLPAGQREARIGLYNDHLLVKINF